MKGSVGTSMQILRLGKKKKINNKYLPIYLRIPKQIKNNQIPKYKHKTKKVTASIFDDMIPKIAKLSNNFPFN